MDTKWKNRLLIMITLLLFSFGLKGTVSGLLHGSEYINKNYFETSEFDYQVEQFISYLTIFELNDLTKQEAKLRITVSDEEINEHRYRYGDLASQLSNIREQYDSKINVTQNELNQDVIDALTAERDAKLEDIKQNFESDGHVRKKIVKEKEEKIDSYFQEIEQFLPEFLQFKSAYKYYLKNVTTGEIYTNLKIDTDKPLNEQINNKDILYSINRTISQLPSQRVFNGIEIPEEVKQKGLLEGKVLVMKSAPTTSNVLSGFYEFQQSQKVFYIYFISSILAFILSILFYKKFNVMNRLNLENIRHYYVRIPFDIRFIILICTIVFTLIFLTIYPFYLLPRYSIEPFLFEIFFLNVLIALFVLQGLLVKGISLNVLKTDLKNSLTLKAFEALKGTFLNRKVGTQLILLLGIVFAFGAGAGLALFEEDILLLYIPAFLIIGLPILILILKQASNFNHIAHNVHQLAHGNLESDIHVKGKSVLAELAKNINTLRSGVKVSQREQAKSERLKTELITNVSHDLRTPLTSIVTYTELLKTPDLAKEEQAAYLEIIDRKTKRLKVLIDDLFEASKMASGNIELSREKVNLSQLLDQALAEHDEMIKKSTLQFRVSKPDYPVHSIVDGQKIWRVFDNLISNILKYGLEHTRVYISLKTSGSNAVITFKNVTKYELGDNTEELFERFKRGDTSRNTEGSGLGLAIAKSIIDLHDGTLDIDVDGDLFKVTVCLGMS